jgi:hypothetical protein
MKYGGKCCIANRNVLHPKTRSAGKTGGNILQLHRQLLSLGYFV